MAKGKAKRIGPIKYLNLAIQDVHIRKSYPGFTCRIQKGLAVWRGPLMPRSVSPVYQMEVHYRLKDIPKVWVISPTLLPNSPHIYGDKSLCLYWPKEWIWHQDTIISETIIPWAADWLYYYELWLDTGKWLGPSSHDYLER